MKCPTCGQPTSDGTCPQCDAIEVLGVARGQTREGAPGSNGVAQRSSRRWTAALAVLAVVSVYFVVGRGDRTEPDPSEASEEQADEPADPAPDTTEEPSDEDEDEDEADDDGAPSSVKWDAETMPPATPATDLDEIAAGYQLVVVEDASVTWLGPDPAATTTVQVDESLAGVTVETAGAGRAVLRNGSVGTQVVIDRSTNLTVLPQDSNLMVSLQGDLWAVNEGTIQRHEIDGRRFVEVGDPVENAILAWSDPTVGWLPGGGIFQLEGDRFVRLARGAALAVGTNHVLAVRCGQQLDCHIDRIDRDSGQAVVLAVVQSAGGNLHPWFNADWVSPDGAWLLLRVEPEGMVLHNIETGRAIEVPGDVWDQAPVSDDGRFAVWTEPTDEGATIHFYELANGRHSALDWPTEPVAVLLWGPRPDET